MQVAATILQQLGGNRFVMMTGAKNFVASENALTFRLPIGAANCVRVTLDPSDTYTVEAFRVRGMSIKPVASASDVYCDNLRAVFESQTGLATSL